MLFFLLFVIFTVDISRYTYIINKKVFIKPDSNKTNEIETLELAVFKELKTRNLKSNVRFNALRKVVDFIKLKYGRSISSIPVQKAELIADYETDKKNIERSRKKRNKRIG